MAEKFMLTVVTAIDKKDVESVGLTPGGRYLIRDIYFPKPAAEASDGTAITTDVKFAYDGLGIGDYLVIIKNNNGVECLYRSNYFKERIEPPSKL